MTKIQVLEERKILLGVTGSIAAYKAIELASQLTKAGALVDVILTEAAQAFVRPLSFQSVTGRRAFIDADLWGDEAHVLHVGLAHEAALYLIAPVTANSMAKLAHGQADNLLTLIALGAECPLALAPAMDVGMYEHPATQSNVEILKSRGAIFIGPVEGRMASGKVGLGRFVEPGEILGWVRQILGAEGSLQNKAIVVTAGGTHEPLDPVRVLANRSSGKQGFALAQAAMDRGAEVTLISGPTSLATPVGVTRVDVSTAAEMLDRTLEASSKTEALIMAAAVADYRPKKIEDQKIKRQEGVLEIKLEPTPDILAEVMKGKKKSGHPKRIIGFAAESQDLLENARKKLEQKGVDLIVANDISATDAGLSVDTNRVTLLSDSGDVAELDLMSKTEVAEQILDRLEALLAAAKG
jgi:phosphopantothenoylcysteine decarboxylase/phosphopantothenate--cysteine ligase